LLEDPMQHDATAEAILERFENCPEEALVPYERFIEEGKTYYFTPGGFLYRQDPEIEHFGGVFCGYLSDEAWHYRTDHS
jgi:hypothetical protein